MSFGAPIWLWSLLAIPALALLFWRAEERTAVRLRMFVAPKLLAQLGATVSRFRRALRFGLILFALALALVSLAKPRWGYTYEEVKRKGLDLLVAVDTSRSMLANDVAPNRLQRVKMAVQDLLGELGGDRIGLIAFAGRAFLQAPLTIDYDAAAEALNNLDTNTIPEGGTNISEAITLALNTFGKSAVGNRALIIFTDGEDLAGDAVRLAKSAADAGVRIYTVGVGTPEGSLIPLTSQNGGSAFVKDSNGQVVKSKLDEKRLRDIAEATGGKFLLLGNGPASMNQLYTDDLAKLQAGEIDARTSRQPIERYQWPLAAALLALAASFLISERKPSVARVRQPSAKRALASAAILLLFCAHRTFAASPGLDEYHDDKFHEAYDRFQETLKEHPDTRATDKIQFDAGAAAYKMKDYGKALQSFSQALLSPDVQLQSRSHYNLGNTLYQQGDAQKNKEQKIKSWTNALQQYEQTLKIEPDNKEAKENYEFVKKKIDQLKEEKPPTPTPTPTPTPSPSPQNKNDKKNDQDKDKDKKQNQSGEGDGKKQNNQDQSQDNKDQSKGNGGQQQSKQSPTPTPTPTPSPSPGEKGASPSPSPSASPSPTPIPEEKGGNSPSPSPGNQGASPTPSPGESGATPTPSPGENGASPSPSPGEGNASPTPTPGEGENGQGDQGATPSPTPAGTPDKKPTGDVKGAAGDQSDQKNAENAAEAEAAEEGEMSKQQAEQLLHSMRDEEQRVQLDEHKAVRRVYKDW